MPGAHRTLPSDFQGLWPLAFTGSTKHGGLLYFLGDWGGNSNCEKPKGPSLISCWWSTGTGTHILNFSSLSVATKPPKESCILIRDKESHFSCWALRHSCLRGGRNFGHESVLVLYSPTAENLCPLTPDCMRCSLLCLPPACVAGTAWSYLSCPHFGLSPPVWPNGGRLCP